MKTETFEHIRTDTEILNSAARQIYGAGEWSELSLLLPTKLEKALATEIAAGELAHAMLRRRIRELENELALFLGRSRIRAVSAVSRLEPTA